MKIGMIRHGKVLFRAPFLTTSEEFKTSIKNYNAADLTRFSMKINSQEFPVCYASALKRAIDTAKIIYDKKIQFTDELNEIPNRSNFFSKIRIPTFIRSAEGRIAWAVNSPTAFETRNQSNKRAAKFLLRILSENHENILLVTHGFFMKSLHNELRQLGFKGHLPLLVPHVKLYVYETR